MLAQCIFGAASEIRQLGAGGGAGGGVLIGKCTMKPHSVTETTALLAM